MSNNELFPEIEVKISEQANFKKNVYLKPGLDLKTNIGRDLHITHAAETASLFKLPGEIAGCGSWDRVKGYNRVNKELVECESCTYKKGITIKEKDKNGNVKDVEYRCKANFALFIEHEDDDKQFVLTNVSFSVYRTFVEYRNSLLKNGLDVNKVITKITKVDPPVGTRGNVYTFEFVSELNLDITEDEQTIMDGIIAQIAASEDKVMIVKDVADFIESMFKINGKTIDKNRTKRLAASMSKDGSTVRA